MSEQTSGTTSPTPGTSASTSNRSSPLPPPDNEDPTTPKTIHISNNNRNNSRNNNASNANTIPPPSISSLNETTITNTSLSSNGISSSNGNNSNGNININGPPSLSLSLQQTTNNTSDDNDGTGSTTMRFQRSIPIHKRSHHNHPFSITSSTRSVKSVGSSIIDTEDDRSQAGMSFMSQDYHVDGSGNGGIGGGSVGVSVSGGKSVISEGVPRIVPKEEDEDDTDLEMEGEHGEQGVVPKNINKKSSSSVNTSNSVAPVLTAGLMETYMREMQFNLQKGLRDLKEQNRRDHERVMTTLQNESNRRTVLEGRLHAQILLQSETMIAMEVKLLKLEAKVERREAASRRRNNSVNFGGENRTGSMTYSASGSIGGGTGGGGGSIGGGTGGGGGGGNSAGAYTSTFPVSRSSGLENGTIEEEDVFDMREIRVNTNESHSRGVRGSLTGSSRFGSGLNNNPTNIAVISSGASLASAVTATSFLDGLEAHDDAHPHGEDDGASGQSADGDVEDEGEDDGSTSTPTQGSRSHFTNLESILLNPIHSSTQSEHGISTRAVRGDYDGNSSLATSVTNTTVASTIVTATTSGVELANSTSVSHRGEDMDSMLGFSPPTATEERPPRSRSQSPLTVYSAATASVGPQSAASVGTVGTSIISTAAVAPARSFRARRDAASRWAGNSLDGMRQITNRVVSFTSNEVLSLPPEICEEAGDSITMPDELDNLSDVADAIADRGRLWRDEYEARLDAIQKRFHGE